MLYPSQPPTSKTSCVLWKGYEGLNMIRETKAYRSLWKNVKRTKI
jgi:hypothetical protein